MSGWFAIPMLVFGGLFAGGVMSIAWERVPAWRGTDLVEFRTAFAHTLRRVDRMQPALLTLSLLSTAAFAVAAGGTARTLAVLAASGFLVVFVGSLAWLVPIQKRLVAATGSSSEAEQLRSTWLRGHLIRTLLALAALILAVVAAVA